MQDRDIVTMEHYEYSTNSYALYLMAPFPVTLSDPKLPQTTIFAILYRVSYLRSGCR